MTKRRYVIVLYVCSKQSYKWVSSLLPIEISVMGGVMLKDKNLAPKLLC